MQRKKIDESLSSTEMFNRKAPERDIITLFSGTKEYLTSHKIKKTWEVNQAIQRSYRIFTDRCCSIVKSTSQENMREAQIHNASKHLKTATENIRRNAKRSRQHHTQNNQILNQTRQQRSKERTGQLST